MMPNITKDNIIALKSNSFINKSSSNTNLDHVKNLSNFIYNSENSENNINKKLFITVNGNKVDLNLSNIMSFYDNVPKENIIFDNEFLKNELINFEQISYDFKLIDTYLEVRYKLLNNII